MDWDLSIRLRKVMEWRGWSQTELAKRAGVTVSGVNKLLQKHNPRAHIGTIKGIALALGVSSDFLLGITDEFDPKPFPPPTEDMTERTEEGAEEKDLLAAVAQLVKA